MVKKKKTVPWCAVAQMGILYLGTVCANIYIYIYIANDLGTLTYFVR